LGDKLSAVPADPPRGDAPRALLDAAEALFATRGFAATTIKEIGAAAGVNPALIYYYFPDKRSLYHEVLDRRLGAFARAAPARLPADLTPLEGIRVLMRAQLEFLRSSQHLARLLARELADHDAAEAGDIIRQIAAGPFRRLTELIREGQRDGQIRPGLDPAFTAVSIMSQVAWFFVAQPVVSRLLGHDGQVPPREAERFAGHATEFALAAVTTKAAVAARPRRTRARR
jgi:AcrR family transcriptional regulator